MYGTIARLHPRADRLDEFRALGDDMRAAPMAGFVASYMFQPDHDPYPQPTAFLIAVFEDEATYKANADSPEDARYRRLRELLEDDPDWIGRDLRRRLRRCPAGPVPSASMTAVGSRPPTMGACSATATPTARPASPAAAANGRSASTARCRGRSASGAANAASLRTTR